MAAFITSKNTQGSLKFVESHENINYTARVADKARSLSGNWVSVKFKDNETGEIKKFQVKMFDGTNDVSFRRNNFSAKVRRFFCIRAKQFTDGESALNSFAGDVLQRYALSQKSISENPELAAANQRLLTSKQLERTAEPFVNSYGFKTIMAPSKVLKPLSLCPQAASARNHEKIAVVLDLDNTLYTEGDYNGGTCALHTLALDPSLPKTLADLKENNPNVRLIILTKSRIQSKELVQEKLKKCGYDCESFDHMAMGEDDNYQYQGDRARNKGTQLLSVLEQLETKQGWKPAKVIHFDDASEELDVTQRACKGKGIKHEGYCVQAAKHFTDFQYSPRVAGEVRDDKTTFLTTEKDMVDDGKPRNRHAYYMLRG